MAGRDGRPSRTESERGAEALLAAIDEGDGIVVGRDFADADISGQALGHVEFEDVTFERCSLAEADIHRASFSDVSLADCDLTGARLAQGYWAGCTLQGCRAVGADLTKSYLKAVRLRDCNLGFVNLSESKLEGVGFVGCDLHEASLARLKLRRTTFGQCDLTRAELFLTRLSGMDLADNVLAGLRLSDGFGELRGARIASDQAVDLVGLLGVKVEQ